MKVDNKIIKNISRYKKLIMGILGVMIGIWIGIFIDAPAALASTAESAGSTGAYAMIVLGSLAWAICWWIGTVVPDWATGVGLMIIWTLTGVSEFKVSFSQYSDSIVWLLIGAFLVSAAVVKTGALRRLSLTYINENISTDFPRSNYSTYGSRNYNIAFSTKFYCKSSFRYKYCFINS